jgi:hypothetical protein
MDMDLIKHQEDYELTAGMLPCNPDANLNIVL